MISLPSMLDAAGAGCAPLRRPLASELLGMFFTSFAISVACAMIPDLVRLPGKLSSLPSSQQWRVRATIASLHQPLAMMYMCPPTEALRIMIRAENPWMVTAPHHLWLSLFYLFGAWAFEVLILLHPATGARRAYGKKGWWVQIVHHIGFPTLSLHNVFSGCAVPGTGVACCTELTVLFSSTYWLLKVAGASDNLLAPVQKCMQVSTFLLRGALVFLMDIFAVCGDQSGVPLVSWCLQVVALIGTNALNFMIINLVQGASNRHKKIPKNAPAGAASGAVESVVGLVVRVVLFPLGQKASDKLLRNLLEELCAATDLRLAFRSGFPGAEDDPTSPTGADASPPPSWAGHDAEAGRAVASGEAAAGGTAFAGPAHLGDVAGRIQRMASDCAGFAVEADKPLMDSGMDSKAAILFSERLSAEFPGVPFPSTLIFDYPTLTAVAEYTVLQLQPRRPEVTTQQRPIAKVPTSFQELLAVSGVAGNFPGGSSGSNSFRQHLALGTDGVLEVPFSRWDLEEYYDPNPDTPGKMYAQHGAFIEGADLFGASFFGVSAPEAGAMDPQQRLVLEAAYAALAGGGLGKKALKGSDIGVLVGQANNDWIQVQSEDIRKITPYTATGTSASISAARISYSLGLKGPAYVVDTACSSALVALDNAAVNVRRARCSSAVSAAANVMASAATYISFSKPRMLSVTGRSLTFDASANGYGRGEGAGAAVLGRLADASREDGMTRGTLRGIAVNQDGLSSTMTAPNGPSQQTVILTALAEASLTAPEVVHMECHGTGTPLGDPIELGALQAINAAREAASPMVFGAVKTNVGHLEGSAASPGILKSIVVLQQSASAPSLHLRSLNPHIVGGMPQVFSTEHLAFGTDDPQQQQRHGGLSSFGFGGTNAHAVLSRAPQQQHLQQGKAGGGGGEPRRRGGAVALEAYPRRAFPWCNPGYRLLRRSPEEGSFEVAMASDVYDVVRHHVVFGSIVVPGVVYVEMALEAARKLFGPGASLTSVTMVFPFVIPDRTTGTEPVSQMRFKLRGSSGFEIQSVAPGGKVTQHVDAKIERGDQSPQGAASPQTVDLEALRLRVAEPVDVATVYEAIHTVGLYLGPMFQVAKELWRNQADGHNEVLARLQLNPAVPNVGYVMHPALFDGTIHILATASIGSSVAGLKIFGAVGRVTVLRQEDFSKQSEYWVHLTVTEKLEASETFTVKVISDLGAVLMILEDVVFRAVKPEQIQMAIAAQSAAPEDDQRMYEVEWVPAEDQAESASIADGAHSSDGRLLVVTSEGPLMDSVRTELGSDCECVTGVNGSLENVSQYSRIVTLLGVDARSSALEVASESLELMKALLAAKAGAAALWIITASTQAAIDGDLAGKPLPLHAGLWGLARTFRNECPGFQCFTLDLVEGGPDAALRLKQLLRRGMLPIEPEVAVRGGSTGPGDGLSVPRLADVTARMKAKGPIRFNDEAPYIITGGTGGLGLIFAEWMLKQGAKHLALLSRSMVPPKESRASFEKLASHVVIRKCDVSSASDVQEVMQSIRKDNTRGIAGVIHAAGALADRLVRDLERSHLQSIYATKVDGTLNLHESLQEDCLDFFVLFSSVAALIGSVGQANYSAGNAFLDSFAQHQRANGAAATVSVQWGPWAEVGMAARAGTAESSIAQIQGRRGLAAMEAILLLAGSNSLLRSATIGVARINWKSLLAQAPVVPLFLKSFAGELDRRGQPRGALLAAGSGLTAESIRSLVVGAIQDALGSPEDLDLSIPVMEMGLDSLASVDFRNRLQAAFGDVELSPTLMFDYPTVPDLVEYIWSQVAPAEDNGGGRALDLANVGEQLALAGLAGRFPGSASNRLADFWQTLCSGLDTTSEVPPERWDAEAFFDVDRDAPGKTYVKLGHFIPGIDLFDGKFFSILQAEQRGMDPHQWLTLEISFDAFHAAGFTKKSLNGLDCGVYVGCATLGGIAPDIPAFGPFTNIGYAYSGLSGRVSHVLSLQGPCFTVDTACSSTIVALDCGSQAIKLGRCKYAMASGVNLQLSPAIWIGFAKMQGLAADGNCKTFDTSADGFARGEGLGAMLLQPTAAAAGGSEACAALLGGVATNHDGRAATITAPNGKAQQRVLRAALDERATEVAAVSCLECHGTGTALGDPIEVGAQKAIYGKGRSPDRPVALAASKTNIGHLEGAAGVAGVSKVALMLQQRRIPPNLWLKCLNIHINNADAGFHTPIPTEVLDWRAPAPRSGVSSFGFSGTNGHAILEAPAFSSDAKADVLRMPVMQYTRQLLRPWREWLQSICFVEEWAPTPEPVLAGVCTNPGTCTVVGEGALGHALRAALHNAGNGSSDDRHLDAVVFAADAEGSQELPGRHLQELVELLQSLLASNRPPAQLLLVTQGCTEHSRARFEASAALWGFARSCRLELPRVTIKCVDMEVGAESAKVVETVTRALAQSAESGLEVAHASGSRCIPRLVKAPNVCLDLQKQDAMRDAKVLGLGTELVTGGLGGLGLMAAQQLANLGAAKILLVSRSGTVAPGFGLERRLQLAEAFPGTVVQLQRCDVGCAEQVADLLEHIDEELPLRGIIHAAGVLHNCLLQDLDQALLARTMEPKAAGAWHLHAVTQDLGLGRFVLFSSISAVLGLAGGAAYAAANAYLDGLARWRRQHGAAAVSVQFGPVAEVGLTAAAGKAGHLEGLSVKALPTDQVASVLRLLLAQPATSSTLRAGSIMCARANWAAFRREVGVDMPHLAEFEEEDEQQQHVKGKAGAAGGSSWALMPLEQVQAQVLGSIRASASSMGLSIEDEAPLMEAGLDSLAAVELRSKISDEFRSVRLPSTLMLDYPTVKEVASHIAAQLAPGSSSASATAVGQEVDRMWRSPPTASSGHLSVLGGACTLPAASSSLGALSCALAAGTDGISEIPYARWDVDAYFGAAGEAEEEGPRTGLEMYVRHAGFIDGAELFDAPLFNISTAEAAAMDPQQRHLLETGFSAFVDAGFLRNALMGSPTGAFVGQDKCDWSRMLSAAHAGPFAATGGSSSISSNRLSYALGLKGPSCTVDTACSSSLVATDTAAATLRRDRCQLAVVCGVNMLLLLQTFIACCQARMLSEGGRCRTFDHSASGYARGEGCGAQILKLAMPPPAAASLSSPSHGAAAAAPRAELWGSALNQDGRSANLTSPNGPSQEAVVLAALSEAQLPAQELLLVESHGTGTALGDPMEVGALHAALGTRGRREPLLIGAVKANCGHLEGGAGMAGLLKLLVSLDIDGGSFKVPANIHLRSLNGHIYSDNKDFPSHFPVEEVQLHRRGHLAASVSSFGFGGTNGSVLLRSKAVSDLPVIQKVQKSEAAIGSTQGRPKAEFNRLAFHWREPAHPLIQKRVLRPDGATVFSCHIQGHVMELLSHHIVHGEIVVPGACYLEMILAAGAAYMGKDTAWCIEQLGFAKPLVLRLVEEKLEEPVELRLSFWPDGRLELESEVGADPEESTVSMHVEATIVQQAGGWESNRPEPDQQDLGGLRARCGKEMDIDVMYGMGVKSGLPLQRRFRAVRHVQTGDRQGLARLEMERDGTHVGFLLGPSLIDSSFQALMALADPEVGLGSLKIPLSIRKLQPTGRQLSIGVWSYFQLLEYTEHSTIFRCWHMNDAGEVLLYFDNVQLQEVREEHLQRVLQASGRVGLEQQALYSVAWDSLPEQALPSDEEAQSLAEVLVLGTEAEAGILGLEGQAVRVELKTHGQDGVDLLDEDFVLPLLLSKDWSAIIFLGGLGEGTDMEALALALHLLRAALRAPRPLCPIWFVTCGGQPQASEDVAARRAGELPEHAGLWGFARAARMEDPEKLQVGCLDLDPQGTGEGRRPFRLETLRALTSAGEYEVALRAGELRGARLGRSGVRARGGLRLNMPVRGSLTNLRPVPQAERRAVAPGFVQLRIRAIGLNFRDVLNVMGLYPGDPGPPGADCAGAVLELGDRVSTLRLGEDVFGEAPGCLSTYSPGPEPLLSQKPPAWSFEEAAAMPVIFVTVEESLGDLAKLKSGERVLIHAAAGGVGLVAIQYAQMVGAKVYATAGSEEKRAHLRSLGVEHITTTRSGEQFEREMARLLQDSGGEGVDVVINSLSHDDYIPRSLALLRWGGRFMEIGKRGVWSHEQMRQSRPDVMYEKIAADTMMEKEPWRYNSYLKRLRARVETGALRPINLHVFEGLEEGVHALQFLQRAQNIGKVVISERSRMLCHPEETPVISGGTGALGVVASQFLVEEGAKSLLLLTRSGQHPMAVRPRWEWLQASTAAVTVHCCDISDGGAVLALKEADALPAKLWGLLHLAGVLADGMLPSLTEEMVGKSYGPKVHGLYHLSHLPFSAEAPFLLFSSTSALFGSPGQANYSAANAVLDSLASYWVAKGQHRLARSIQWGPWAEAGMAVEKNTLQRAKASGLAGLSSAQGMTILGTVLAGNECSVGAAHIRWAKFLPAAYAAPPPFLAALEAEAKRAAEGQAAAAAAEASAVQLSSLARLPPELREAAVRDAVLSLAREVVGNDALGSDEALLESGMDSLSGVEFRNRLQKEFGGLRIPNSAVFEHPTAGALAGLIDGMLGARAEGAAAEAQGREGPPGGHVDPSPPTPSSSSRSQPSLLERLNTRKGGVPVFLVPGAGMQAAAFQVLAELLPLPAYGVTWPKDFLPRDEWPSSLTEFAELLLRYMRGVHPEGPYVLVGHSFGATVCLELARIAEAAGHRILLVALLDARSLPPVGQSEEPPGAEGLLGTLALLSQTVDDGSKYAAQMEELSRTDAGDHLATLEQRWSPAAAATLRHVQETTQWYAGMLRAWSDDLAGRPLLASRKVLFHVAETWLQQPEGPENLAEAAVRAVQTATFQRDADVTERLAAWCGGEEVPATRLPGDHFSMLRDPHVTSTALRLCHALVDAGAAGFPE